MLEPNLTHIAGAKWLGGALMPASLVVIGGVLVWQLWQSKKAIRQLAQQEQYQN
ncbi:heme exporter protein CcmD [Thioflexithrix psekupsensis]|nr:heme exporter protein CcmD [Thioflexithrix psekupsensis]